MVREGRRQRIQNCHDPGAQGSVQIAQSSGRLQKNASHASVVPPIYQSSSNDSGNGCLAWPLLELCLAATALRCSLGPVLELV